MITALTRCLLVLLIAATVLAHFRLIRNLKADGENSLTEGETLYALMAVQHRQTLYHDFSHPPYVLTQYTPLFYLAPGLLARWLDTGTLTTFAVGRGYAYGCWLGVAVLIYRLARRLNCGRTPAALAALVFLSAPLTTGWANSYRPDSAAVFFSLAAVLAYTGRRRLLVTIPLLAIAFLNKQSAVVALLVIVLEELWTRNWLRAAGIAAGWSAIVAVPLWWAQRQSDGAFAMNCFGSLAQMHDWRWPLYLLGGALMLGLAGFAGGSLAVIALPGSERPGLLTRYFLLSLAFAFFSSAKFGSWTNYYIEPFAVTCVLTAVGLDRWRQHPVFCATLLAVALGLAVDTAWHRHPVREDCGTLVTTLRQLGEPLLIENVYVAARSGVEPYMLNPGIFARLERAGRFDALGLRRAIEQRKFAAIVCSLPLDNTGESRPFPPAWIELMRRHYSLAGRIESPTSAATLWVYRP